MAGDRGKLSFRATDQAVRAPETARALSQSPGVARFCCKKWGWLTAHLESAGSDQENDHAWTAPINWQAPFLVVDAGGGDWHIPSCNRHPRRNGSVRARGC